MRTRKTDTRTSSTVTTTDFWPNGDVYGSPNVNHNASKAQGTLKQITDVPHRGYVRRQAAGEVIMSPVEILTDDRSTTPTLMITTPTHPTWGSRRFEGDCACQWKDNKSEDRPAWFLQDIERAKVEVVNNCFAKAYTSTSMSLVTLAEAGKTLKMLRRPFSSALSNLTKIARRRDRLIQKGQNLSDATTSAWLEYRLGWKPVLYDIKLTMQAFERVMTNPEIERQVFRAGKRLSLKQSGTYYPPVSGLTSCLTEWNHNVDVKISAGAVFDIAADSLYHSASKAFGLSLTDLPAAGWELIPLSFVVDRFLDVGTWLNAIVATPGMTLRGSWLSVVDDDLVLNEIVSANKYVATPPATDYRFANCGTYRQHIKSLTRSVDVRPSVLPPVTSGGLSTQQQLDHLALVLAKLTGLTKKR